VLGMLTDVDPVQVTHITQTERVLGARGAAEASRSCGHVDRSDLLADVGKRAHCLVSRHGRRKAGSGADFRIKFFVVCGGGVIIKGAAKFFPTSGLSGGVEL